MNMTFTHTRRFQLVVAALFGGNAEHIVASVIPNATIEKVEASSFYGQYIVTITVDVENPFMFGSQLNHWLGHPIEHWEEPDSMVEWRLVWWQPL